MFKGHIKTDKVAGTGSAINVELGFTPKYVKLFNYEDADSLFPTIEWWSGMTAAHGLKNKRQAVAEGGTASYSVVNEKITSGGISEYAGTDGGKSKGFTIGTDADMNVSGEDIYYIAVGGED